MIYLILVFIVVDFVQMIYIKYLQKEICLRDGNYRHRSSGFLAFLKKLKIHRKKDGEE